MSSKAEKERLAKQREEFEELDRYRAKLCTDCPFYKKKIRKDCVNCYTTNIINTRRSAFEYAMNELKIPEQFARRMFRRGDIL